MPVVKQRLVYFPVDDRCYNIACSTSEDLFADYAGIFDTAINSVVIETPAPVTLTPSPSPSPSETPTSVPAAEAPEEPGFEIVFAIVGIVAVAYIVKRRV